ncbi:unnamed protein product, partial [Prorocentrum cordatum]
DGVRSSAELAQGTWLGRLVGSPPLKAWGHLYSRGGGFLHAMTSRMVVVTIRAMFSFFFVAGTAEWTSQKEGEKIAADANRSKKKLAEIEAIRRSSSDADLLLKNNTHILGIINETLTRRKSADVRILHKIEGQTKVLEQDAKVRSEKKAALSSATDKASRASAAAKQARHALEEANRTFARKLADKRSVEAALSKAKEHLEDVVQNIGSSDVIAADMDVKDKA